MTTGSGIRVLVSKLGLDGHDRGAKLVAHTLKQDGMDVTYLGIRHTIGQVVETAVRNDVQFLGLSFLAGDHMTWVPRVIRELRQRQADGIRLIVGGIIPLEEIPKLESMGVDRVFLPGTPLKDIATYIKTHATAPATET
jgi:methylmalonyl-CoA mutase C-terminal domain/subunit